MFGFVAAFAAFEQTIVSVVLLLGVALVAGDRERRRVYVGGVVGAVLGRIVLTVWLRANGITHDRSYWISHFGPSHFLHQFTDSLGVLLLTTLGGAVVLVVAALGGGLAAAGNGRLGSVPSRCRWCRSPSPKTRPASTP